MHTKVGTTSSDTLVSEAGWQAYGMSGNDNLVAQDKFTNVMTDGQVLLGGSGNDGYLLPQNSYTFILDTAGDNDTIGFPFNYAPNQWSGFTLDNNFLMMANQTTNTTTAIIDYSNPDHAIETVSFLNGDFTWGQFMQIMNFPNYSSTSVPWMGDILNMEMNLVLPLANALAEAENVPFGFNENYYDNLYPDIAAAIDSLVVYTGGKHFMDYGIHEGRRPNLAFDQEFYFANNPDVAQAVAQGTTTGYQHFLDYGQFEGRQGSAEFNADAYLAANPDVAAAVAEGNTTAFQHFAEYGQFEGRLLAPNGAVAMNLVGVPVDIPVDMA